MTDFSRPLVEWPLLLCGPILRRVTSNSVAVFLATKEACSVRLLIRDPSSQSSGWTRTSTAQATRQIGERLHVLVVELSGFALSPGRNYTYDVEMTPQGSSAQGLADQPGLLHGPIPLGYSDGTYPSFSLAPNLESSRILHGSCRKPHGGGPDGLVIVDELIKAAHDGPAGPASSFAENRPHLLLLTGDQIYADDVSVALLVALRSAAKDLMGSFGELFPPGNFALTAPEIQPGKSRMSWLKANAKPELSSEHYDNHLMFLGEFYAMYLFCWSEVLWPDLSPWPTIVEMRTVWLDESSLYSPPIDVELQGQVKEAEKEARAALSEVVRFAVGMRRVRRALANVPTMMAFDDHEVTDDWNIDAYWDDNARGRPAVNRIVRNGLAAFAVFQSWGNMPDRFISGLGMQVLDAISKTPSGGTAVPQLISAPHSMDALLDVGPTAVPNANRMLWDWTLDGPGYRIIALDSRTHRDFSDGEHTGLLTSSEITRQLEAHRPATTDDRLCFVIAPAPVIGHPLVEEIAQPLMFRLGGEGDGGRRAADLEAWTANRQCFENLLRTLAGFGSVVLLSGDVHYAYTNHTAYHATRTGSSSGIVRSRIIQLCASALKNTDRQTKVIQQAGFAGFEAMGRSWLGTDTVLTRTEKSTLASNIPIYSANHPWDTAQLTNILDAFGNTARVAKLLALKLGVIDAVADKYLVAAYWVLTLDRREELPLVLPDGPWFTQRALDQVAAIYAADPACWKYRTTYVRDIRPSSARFDVVRGSSGTRGPTSGANMLVIGQAQSVIGFPSLGDIKVVRDSASGLPRKLIHRLHWWLPNLDLATTEHEAPLNVPETGTNIPYADQVPVAHL